MTNLTEQWKKDKLKDGFYYVAIDEPFMPKKVEIIEFYKTGFETDMDSNYMHEVLAEVPSYEQWQEYKNANDSMFDTIKMLNKDNFKLEKENTKLKKWCEEFNALDVAKEKTKLKELLKECADEFESYLDSGAEGMAKAIREVLKDE